MPKSKTHRFTSLLYPVTIVLGVAAGYAMYRRADIATPLRAPQQSSVTPSRPRPMSSDPAVARNRYRNLPRLLNRSRERREDLRFKLRMAERQINALQRPIETPNGSDLGSYNSRTTEAWNRVHRMRMALSEKRGLQTQIADLDRRIRELEREYKKLKVHYENSN